MRSQRKRSEGGISTEFYTAGYIFHHHKSRLLLVVGQNAGLWHFCIGFAFQTWMQHLSFKFPTPPTLLNHTFISA